MKKVAIIHPWFPQYRQEFFAQLVQIAADHDVEIKIFHGDPPPEWKQRGDSVETEYSLRLETRFLRVGRKSLAFKSLRRFHEEGPFDYVVLEQAVRNLETYAILFQRRLERVGFWGHGRTYTQAASPSQELLKRWLTRRTDWFFAYTEGGAESVRSSGFPSDRITVVNNSVDTRTLRKDIVATSDRDIAQFKEKYGLGNNVALYLGGVDEAKRIPFLLEAAELCYQNDASFRLVVVGKGNESDRLSDFPAEWLVPLGPLFGKDKALAMAASDVLTIPGRVGLVAVESFAAGLPIVTCDWPWHAPEFEYLEDGYNALVTRDEAKHYAYAVSGLLTNPARLKSMKQSAWESLADYSTEAMVQRFWKGLSSALDD